MTAIKITNFGGLVPKVGVKLLPDNLATECRDVKLFSGELRGWPLLDTATPIKDFNDGLTYKYVTKLTDNQVPQNTTFFGSVNELASIVPDPALDEAFDRYYLFEPGVVPKVATFTQIDLGQTPDTLALPRPTVAPTLVPTSGAPDGATPAEDRVYLFTWQTSWGEETEPSPTSTVTVAADDSVDLTNIEQPPAIGGRTFDKINIYRSAAGSISTTFFFVATIVPPIAVYTDTLQTAFVVYNAVLSAFDNEAPPDGLQGARVHPSGALVAFLGREVWFSKPFLPHAWPATTKITVDDAIIGVEVFGQSIAVMTGTFVYLIYGQTPGQFGLRKFPFASPGLSYRSIVATEDGVYFCSVRGLMFVNDSGPKNITAQVIDFNEWEVDFFNGDVVAVMYGRIYMAWDRVSGGFMVDMREERVFLTNWDSATGVTALNNDWYTGDILVTIEDKVFLWDDATAGTDPRSYTWQSKTFDLNKPVCFAAMYIEGDLGGTAQITFFADEILRFDELVNFNAMRRLPSGFKARDWKVKIVSSDNLQNIAWAETGRELGIV